MLIVGLDEVGLGALAGPIVCAAVCMDYPVCTDQLSEFWPLEGVRDSKKLSVGQREVLRTRLPRCLYDREAGVGIGTADVYYINEHGYSAALAKAAQEAVEVAVEGMDEDLLIVDGVNEPAWYAGKTLVEPKADNNYFVVAAASILAKLTRDDTMIGLDRVHPQYDWAQNKGYPTTLHKEGLIAHGLTHHHRKQPCATVLKKVKPRRRPKGW